MFKKIAIAAALATLAGSSFAAPQGPFYAGVDVGATQIHADDSDTSYGGFVGYRFNQNVAVEAGYRRLGQWDFGVSGYKVDQASLSAVGTLPLSNGFNVYGRLGYNNLDASGKYVSGSESNVLYGVGVGYDFGGNIAGRVEVQKPSGAFTNVGVSVLYSF
jgi:OOP family OmpA-OmpF porin